MRLFYTVKLSSSIIKDNGYKLNLSFEDCVRNLGLFYTVKLSSSIIKDNGYKLNLSFEDCVRSNLIVSLADS